jgi:hypothetical protein
MRYYQDPVTGSIYSLWELEELLGETELELREVLRSFRAVPDATWLLLEEAEAIAAESDQRRSGFEHRL